MNNINLIVTTASISAFIAALFSFVIAKATVKFEQRKERYTKIASKLDECWMEVQAIGPPSFDNTATATAFGEPEKVATYFNENLARFGEVWNVYQRYSVYLSKETRSLLEGIDNRMSKLKSDASMKVATKGLPDSEGVEIFLMEYIQGSLKFGNVFYNAVKTELAEYNDRL